MVYTQSSIRHTVHTALYIYAHHHHAHIADMQVGCAYGLYVHTVHAASSSIMSIQSCPDSQIMIDTLSMHGRPRGLAKNDPLPCLWLLGKILFSGQYISEQLYFCHSFTEELVS
jgi:hypothetical protein